ncbi:MAG: Smr/MutS family protein [Desulfobacterales bacterium]|nr:Smr/MutS family protein [Desulfobacterales bacterium]
MENHRKKTKKTRKKNDLPILKSDEDFMAAFLDESSPSKKKNEKKSSSETGRVNRHGLPFIDEYETRFLPEEEKAESPVDDASDMSTDTEPEDVDFAQLLEESFRQRKPGRTERKPVPLKRRLKRYPPPEADLDLHGFTAIGAEAKAKSFIHGAKLQGFFTLRIIVGRGLHSQEGPVLPDVMEDLLKQMRKDKLVLDFKWERKKKDRSGAVIVYLNRFDD